MRSFTFGSMCMIIGLFGVVHYDIPSPRFVVSVILWLTGACIMSYVSERIDKFVKEFKRVNGMKDK